MDHAGRPGKGGPAALTRSGLCQDAYSFRHSAAAIYGVHSEVDGRLDLSLS
jgi:hypothetical protein